MSPVSVEATRLVLASQSPRRSELLSEMGHSFQVVAPDTDEAHDPTLSPQALTRFNARAKAEAGSKLHPEAITIGADTLVYIDGDPLGKPQDMEEATDMLLRLSGRQHQVCTGVAFAVNGDCIRDFAVVTEVWFLPLTEQVVRAYHSQVSPLDKAGAYGIQQASEMILDRIEGSWNNVVGLPTEQLKIELDALLNVDP